jgi:hypothetical protein
MPHAHAQNSSQKSTVSIACGTWRSVQVRFALGASTELLEEKTVNQINQKFNL